MKGSLTVEASYLFPLCFLMIGITCCLGIFLYDQAVLKMTGYECILQTLDECQSDNALEEALLKRAKETAEMRTLAVEDLNTAVKVTVSKVSVSYSGVQTVLDIPIEVTVVYEKTFPELTLRLIRKKQEIDI